MPTTDDTGMHGAEESLRSPCYISSLGIIPALCEQASEMHPLPTYLAQQCSLDWHHISQVKWKLVPNPGAQPKEKRVSGSRTRVRCQSSGVRIPATGGSWHFAGEMWKRHDPRFTMVYKSCQCLRTKYHSYCCSLKPYRKDNAQKGL